MFGWLKKKDRRKVERNFTRVLVLQKHRCFIFHDLIDLQDTVRTLSNKGFRRDTIDIYPIEDEISRKGSVSRFKKYSFDINKARDALLEDLMEYSKNETFEDLDINKYFEDSPELIMPK